MSRKATAGSFKKGDLRAGRPKGSKNRRSVELFERMTAHGLDPDAMVRACIEIAADPKAKRGERIYAAATGLPYFFSKLASIEVDLKGAIASIEPKDRDAARRVLDEILGKT